jgi:CRP/FNR family transcriptional regulator
VASTSDFSPVDLDKLSKACSTYTLRELCLPAAIDPRELEPADARVVTRRQVKRGEPLYNVGGELRSLYVLRLGFIKTCVLRDDREQVAGFHMSGDLLGLDAMGSGRHLCDAVALEDSEVCGIDLPALERVTGQAPSLQRCLQRVISGELARDGGAMSSMSTMRAEERLAAFLLDLSGRFSARGYSSTEFVLRMTREEIGSFLDLTLETVSRALSRFQEDGLIEVQTKHIKLREIDALRALIAPAPPAPAQT